MISKEKFTINNVYSSRTKHIDVRYKILKEQLDNDQFVLEYCPTEEMVADLLTKSLGFFSQKF